MYRNILVAIDLNDETSCHKPLVSAVEVARTFGARLHVLTVREVEAILQAKTATHGYEVIVAHLKNRLDALIRRVDASDLDPSIRVASLTARASMPRFWGSRRKPGPISSSSDRVGRR
jgi:hypothetical protein